MSTREGTVFSWKNWYMSTGFYSSLVYFLLSLIVPTENAFSIAATEFFSLIIFFVVYFIFIIFLWPLLLFQGDYGIFVVIFVGIIRFIRIKDMVGSPDISHNRRFGNRSSFNSNFSTTNRRSVSSTKTTRTRNKKYCHRCGTVLQANHAYCKKCGVKIRMLPTPSISRQPRVLTNKETCPHCFSEIVSNSKFCLNCGKKIVMNSPTKVAPVKVVKEVIKEPFKPKSAAKPFFCQLDSEKHPVTDHAFQCLNCGRMICENCYKTLEDVGYSVGCPFCEGDLTQIQ